MKNVAAIDDVLPLRIIRALKTQIIEDDARDSGTHWYALDTPPRLMFERVIQHLRTFVPHAHELVGAEWWFRATPTDTGFPFHFDRDEGIRTSVISPDLASILYLSNAGGPTVVVDATPTRRSAPTAGVVIHPRPARFLVFPGALLHGVLPGPPGRWPRVTMLVNWWRSVPRLERARPLADRPGPERWRATSSRRVAALEALDPARLLSKAAWRELVAKQASYR